MRALAIGSAVIDIVSIVGSDEIERMTMHNATSSFLLLAQGEKMDAESITTHVGGGAANVSVSMARLGIDVSALVKVGTDSSGDHILEHLAAEGVNTDLALRAPRLPTGSTVMIASHDRNATIFTFRGANAALAPEEIPVDRFDGYDLVYVSTLSNRSADCFPRIVEGGKEKGCLVAVNPGIRQLTYRNMPFLEHLKDIDILTLNRTEAERLVPAIRYCTEVGAEHERLINDPDAPSLMAKGFHAAGIQMGLGVFMKAVQSLGPGIVVVTDGTDGAYMCANSHILHCPTLPADVAGTAGAGDAFASTLVGLVASGAEHESALRAATVNAASVIGQVDTQSGLLARDALDARLAGLGDALPTRSWAI